MNMRGIDPITGLPDRGRCLECAREIVLESSTGLSLVVLWIGLDRLKQINASFGHMGGDAVLMQMAIRLREQVPVSGLLFRAGGDEFVCLVRLRHQAQAFELAELLRRTIDTPLPFGEILLHPSASIGIAVREQDEDPFVVLQRADQAMITAKSQGGNRIVASGDEPVPGRMGVLLAHEELVIENQLHIALENGGLQLHYQPIISRDGRIEAVEALMRCNAEGKGIPPVRFIPVAEKTGLITRIGEWSLLEGANFARQLYRAGFPTKVAINVSRAQLTSAKFSQALHAALICSDTPPSMIELELTESLFMDNSATVQKNLSAAREAGIALAIDDFGTGYSCLANLKDIPATKLKLDRAFVVMLPEDKRALAVVRAMTQLGRELGMTVVAEGVETQGQLDALLDAGVDAIQGYINAKAMPEDELTAWLARRPK